MNTLQDQLISVRRKLLADTEFSSLVGTDIGVDQSGGPWTDGWVFKSTGDMLPERNPQNSGKSAVVFDLNKPWTNPNPHNTARFPLLSFRIYSDVSRATDPALPVITNDADTRCARVADAIRHIFHQPQNNDHFWPNGVYVTSSLLWNDLVIEPVDGDDGLVYGDMSFALVLG